MKRVLSVIFCFILVFVTNTEMLIVDASIKNTLTISFSKIESKPQGFKVIWKKKSNVKGYQIQYSTSSKFKKSSTKTKTINKTKTTSTTINKLKGCNKKYYVRVRTYKISNSKNIYSSWSKAKTVTTLKHNYIKATCTKAKICKYCKKTSGKKLGHKYTNVCDTKCNVCKSKRIAPHKYTNACDKSCNICKAVRKAPHKYSNACDTKCNVCKVTRVVKHLFDNSGKCVYCKQILSVSPNKVKSREYEWWNGFDVLSFDFATSIAGEGLYSPCSIVYSEARCGDKKGHIIVNGVGSHCVGGSGPLSFNYKKTDKYIIISNLESYETMVLTLQVLSNDTLRVVALSGTAPNGLKVGDIFN